MDVRAAMRLQRQQRCWCLLTALPAPGGHHPRSGGSQQIGHRPSRRKQPRGQIGVGDRHGDR
ncbi:Uncharacterised protein [Mycobacterium tuberculosis]|nr:Uncharacterised protein [Mycobacterium tuberculosis]